MLKVTAPLDSAGVHVTQSRLVTDDVQKLAGFYAGLLGVPVTLNEYYVEVPAGPVTIGFSRRTFTEYRLGPECCALAARQRDSILDFQVQDADAEYERIAALGATLVVPPTTQPWGSRATIFADPDGNLINMFARS